jgi:hypothetical protein
MPYLLRCGALILLHKLAHTQLPSDLDLPQLLSIALLARASDIVTLVFANGVLVVRSLIFQVVQVHAHAVGILAVGVVLGLGADDLESESVLVKAQGGDVAFADVKGDVFAVVCFEHGFLWDGQICVSDGFVAWPVYLLTALAHELLCKT